MKALAIDTYATVGVDDRGRLICERGLTERQAKLRANKIRWQDGGKGEVYKDIDIMADGVRVMGIYAKEYWQWDRKRWKKRRI